MSNRLLLGLSVALFVAGAASVLVRAYTQSQAFGVQGELISGPGTWVPFEAEFRITSTREGHVTFGRVYRASNGSLRRDSHTTAVPYVHTVIFNISKRAAYFSRPPSGTDWELRPLILPKSGYVPTRQMSLESRTLPRKAPEQIDRFRAWEQVGGAKDGPVMRRYVAPELNFFPLRSQDGDSNEEISGVVLREPDPALFELPPGAQIVRTLPPTRYGRFTREELKAGGPGLADWIR